MQKSSLLEKFDALKLRGMSRAFNALQISEVLDNTEFENALHHLLDEEKISVTELLLQRNHRAAKLRWPQAKLDDIDYRAQYSLDKKQIVRLAECAWIEHHQHVAVIGKTGTGKTSLACALANQALESGYKVRFYRFNELIALLQLAQNRDELTKFINQLIKIHVLILDDWAIMPLDSDRRHVLFELIERREKNSSLIITSQYDYGEWHQAFQDDVLADAVLDRIVHSANKIVIDQGSLRKEYGLVNNKQNKRRAS